MKVSAPAGRIRRRIWPAWRPRPVTERMALHSGLEEDIYYLCPGCGTLLPREYMRFCDCCGQRLGWSLLPEDGQSSEGSSKE